MSLLLQENCGRCTDDLNKLSVEIQLEIHDLVFDTAINILNNHLINDISNLITDYCGREKYEENIMLNEWKNIYQSYISTKIFFDKTHQVFIKIFFDKTHQVFKFIDLFPTNFFYRNFVVTRYILREFNILLREFNKYILKLTDKNLHETSFLIYKNEFTKKYELMQELFTKSKKFHSIYNENEIALLKFKNILRNRIKK
jgi:hypothetical protein